VDRERNNNMPPVTVRPPMPPSNFPSRLAFACLWISMLSCDKQCDELPVACELVPEAGPCFAAIPKFYYDAEAEACATFIWGGCGGTVPFDTLSECERCECH